jgi:hypothetical protein
MVSRPSCSGIRTWSGSGRRLTVRHAPGLHFTALFPLPASFFQVFPDSFFNGRLRFGAPPAYAFRIIGNRFRDIIALRNLVLCNEA